VCLEEKKTISYVIKTTSFVRCMQYGIRFIRSCKKMKDICIIVIIINLNSIYVQKTEFWRKSEYTNTLIMISRPEGQIIGLCTDGTDLDYFGFTC